MLISNASIAIYAARRLLISSREMTTRRIPSFTRNLSLKKMSIFVWKPSKGAPLKRSATTATSNLQPPNFDFLNAIRKGRVFFGVG